MSSYHFIWTDESIEHVGDHGISVDEYEHVVSYPEDVDFSDTSGKEAAFGHLPDGRNIIAIFEMIDEITVVPVTAYEVPEPRMR